MIKKMLIIGIFFLLSSCASLPDTSSLNTQQLTEKNIKQINGVYNNSTKNTTKRWYHTVSGKLTGKQLKDTISHVKIEVLKNEEILFSFLKYKTKIDSKIIKYKITKDGFLLLKNKNFRLHGIPYILGDYEIKKHEIGLSNLGHLIMNGAEKREGAFLIIFWGPPGATSKFTNIYDTI